VQQPVAVGVGEALRRVRTSRGLSLEEAARDTRVRREFLEAIEQDDYSRLLGDVHVRGCLRTYASYLRLSPDKVVSAYLAAAPEAQEPHPAATPHQEPVLGARRRRDNHRLFVMVAATILVLAAAFGVLSARQPAPPPAELPSEAPSAAFATARGMTVAVLARRPVDVTIVADGGEPQPFSLEAGEGRSFDAESSITVHLSEGGTAEITVSGADKGFPGAPGRPWQHTYDFETATPTPAG
jgi:transcriptional regulator with XRE-family HTH domain